MYRECCQNSTFFSCPNWLNEDGDVFAVKSLCEGMYHERLIEKKNETENLSKPYKRYVAVHKSAKLSCNMLELELHDDRHKNFKNRLRNSLDTEVTKGTRQKKSVENSTLKGGSG